MQALSRIQCALEQPEHPGSARTRLGPWLGLLFVFFSIPAIATSPEANTNEQQIAAVKAKMNAAMRRVQQIVNQPVLELRRTPDMHVVVGHHGWFDQGSVKPDFLHVDVTKSQKLPYLKYKYVTTTLNPGVVFLGSDLEFNHFTKYFYTNLSLPKKRLTEAEMLEINKLYRVIGHCEQRLSNLEHPGEKKRLAMSQGRGGPQIPSTMLATIHRFIFTHKPLAGGIVAGLFALIILLRIIRMRQQ